MSKGSDELHGVFIESEDEEELNEKLNAKALTDKGLDPKSFNRQESDIIDVQTSPGIKSPKTEPTPQGQDYKVLGKQEVIQSQPMQGLNSAPQQSDIQHVSGMNNQNSGGYGYDMGFQSKPHSNTAPPPNQYGQYPNQGPPPQNPYGGYQQM
jgi:hypothetical protein